MTATPEFKKKVQKGMVNRWKDPEYRKMMLEKQRRAGLRTYPTPTVNK